ncbi:hypothetical protein [Lacticaseibacillus parakribbianus]|uniref:hypothetical protein n=1 Tax=Lacticaseibacillus parakribbianus TaxID=2970927 RepID=UPI0021CB3866|nr:hypothetical protein [Lacticaseibacillus parakribbianus]
MKKWLKFGIGVLAGVLLGVALVLGVQARPQAPAAFTIVTRPSQASRISYRNVSFPNPGHARCVVVRYRHPATSKAWTYGLYKLAPANQ